MRNKVNTEIKAAKELFYNNKFTETNGDPRKTWQIIHDLTSPKAVNLSISEIILLYLNHPTCRMLSMIISHQ